MTRQLAEPRATSWREWALAVAGGLALSAVMVMVLRPSAPAQPAAVMAPARSLAAVPQPAAPLAAPAPPALILRGILGSGAILEGADGKQRLVRVGGVAAPGTRLAAVGAGTVELESRGQRITLGFPGVPLAAAGTKPPGANSWRLAMSPLKQGGQMRGFRLDDLSALPMLAAAGLKRGDVLVSANGNALASDEKVGELGDELAANGSIVLVYERAGQMARVTVSQPR
ncbi:hypothetical protein [Sandarakinorhabdus sp.]|uniref:hypothetical protein n=1 Tax=Sandarakinorhabdus sp. TaxID=1916663 RepID=UPI00286D70EA|nr:hypothetical protein [Sandarakinorhabdus sp.]